MKITISPVAGLPGQPETEIVVFGDTITVDGIAYDLSVVPHDGEATPEGEHPFLGAITRTSGEISCTVRAIYDPTTAEPCQPADLAHWVLSATDGPVPLKILRKEGADV